MDDAIVLKGLRKSFRTGVRMEPKEVLQGLDLRVRPGSIFGFLGPNGAGKTTTIKTVVGLVRPTAGQVTVFGHPAGTAKAAELLGFLPENPYFYEYLNPAETLNFYGGFFAGSRAERRELVEELLDKFDLQTVRNQRIKTFSKGMRQRLGMAQALVGRPQLLVLDEPMSGLDPIGRHRIKEAIRDAAERGITVFFSSHILADVEDLCSEVGLLLSGQLAKIGSLEELLVNQSQTYLLQFDRVTRDTARSLQSGGLKGKLSGERFLVRTEDPDEVGPLLDQVRQAGGRILAVQPLRETLEEYFVRQAGS